MESPKDYHWKARKRVLRYIVGTSTYGLSYEASTDSKIVGYIDSDYAGCIDDRKSTYGYAFLFGRNLISWSSKKKPIVALSSTKVEYVATNSASCQALWLKRLLSDFGYTENEPISILCDNTSAISLSKNNVFHQKSKHIDTRFHFIRELVKNGDIVLKFFDSKD